MKRRYGLTFIIFLTISFLFLIGCRASETPTNIELNERVVSWSDVKGASSYVLKVNDSEYEVTVNEFTLPNQYFGEITISVKAVFPNSESAYSVEVVFTAILQLQSPTNIRQEGNKVLWDEVGGATSYILKINGVEHMTTNTEYVVGNLGTEIQILAAGRSDGLVLSSDYSAVFTMKLALQNPTGLSHSNGVISWNSVSNASKYLVIINDSVERETTVTNISLKYEFVGSVNVKVKAISTNPSYLDSGFSEGNFNLEKLTLSAPVDLDVNNGILSFSSVLGATGYEIYANGTLLQTVTSTTYPIPSEVLNDSSSYLQVKAISNLHNSSILSAMITVNVISITTEAELRAMVSYGSYVLENDIALTLDWEGFDFYGVFNGNGKKITNVNVVAVSKNVGFFNKLEGAIVRNLTLEGNINVTTNIIESNIGGIAGLAINSDISNCFVNMDINAVSSNGIGTVGGVIGTLEYTNIRGTEYTGDIDTRHFITGGMVGKASNPEKLSTIEKSSVTGKIVVTGGEQSFAGGFIGLFVSNSLTVKESFADVDLTGTSYVGGFVGYLGSGMIENCYTRGSVKTTASTIVHMGGFIGRLEGYNAKVTSSISMVSLVKDISGEYVFVGGFVGRTVGGSYARIYENCYYDNTLAPLDRIGNPSSGTGDGILAKSTSDLQNMSLNSSFNTNIWTFTNGSYPKFSWELPV